MVHSVHHHAAHTHTHTHTAGTKNAREMPEAICVSSSLSRINTIPKYYHTSPPTHLNCIDYLPRRQFSESLSGLEINAIINTSGSARVMVAPKPL